MNECLSRKVSCEQCNQANIALNQLSQHIRDSCPETLVLCPNNQSHRHHKETKRMDNNNNSNSKSDTSNNPDDNSTSSSNNNSTHLDDDDSDSSSHCTWKGPRKLLE